VVRDRLLSLAKANDLTLKLTADGTHRMQHSTLLHTLIGTILSPYDGSTDKGGARVTISGPDIPIAGDVVTGFALLLHEFATNATKYGALSSQSGSINIACSENTDQFVLTWTERGGPPVGRQAEVEGFGTLLSRATVQSQFGGGIAWDWNPAGLTIDLSFPKDRIVAHP
jgi:two-component sensor histidine kinase